MQQLDNVVD